MARFPAVLSALFALASAPIAAAGDWTVLDLGETLREDHCLEAAEIALDAEALAFGGQPPRRRGWTVVAEGLGKNSYEAVLLCTHGSSGRTRGSLVLRSEQVDALRAASADRIADAWAVKTRLLDAALLRDVKL